MGLRLLFCLGWESEVVVYMREDRGRVGYRGGRAMIWYKCHGGFNCVLFFFFRKNVLCTCCVGCCNLTMRGFVW